MMAVENAPAIAEALVKGGRDADTPVAVVCDGTMPAERTVLATLGTLADELERQRRAPPGDHRGRRGGPRRPSRAHFAVDG